jgi:hypothetical protein
MRYRDKRKKRRAAAEAAALATERAMNGHMDGMYGNESKYQSPPSLSSSWTTWASIPSSDPWKQQ